MKAAFLLVLAVTCMSLGACWSSRDDGFNYGHRIVECVERGTC